MCIAALYAACGGADSPRPIKLRKKSDGAWCLWEQADNDVFFVRNGVQIPCKEANATMPELRATKSQNVRELISAELTEVAYNEIEHELEVHIDELNNQLKLT